jgi:HK97 family phage major capsid protein
MRFDLAKALAAHRSGNWSGAAAERDAHEAIRAARAAAGRPVGSGLYVPLYRSLSSVDGAALIAPTTPDYAQTLHSRSVAVQAGASVVYESKVGSVSLPYVQEGGPAPSADIQFLATTATFEHVIAMLPYTRQLALQSNLLDSVVRAELGRQVAANLDRIAMAALMTRYMSSPAAWAASLSGSAETVLTPAAFSQLESGLLTHDSLGSNCSVVASASLATAMQSIDAIGAPLWKHGLANGRVRDYPARASRDIDANTLVFGDFSELFLVLGSDVEIEVDRRFNFAAGTEALRCSVDAAAAVRRDRALAVIRVTS